MLPITLILIANINKINMFNEIYFWTYNYLRKIKTNDTPAFNSYLLICIFQGANVGTIWVIINYFLKVDIDKNTAVALGIVLTVLLSIINYFLLYANREDIFTKYNNLQTKRRLKGQIYFWIYVLMSFTLFYVSVANLVELKQ
jgi:hypothetical protein